MKDKSQLDNPDPSEDRALLRRILELVEKDSRSGGLELMLAILLSFATLASTWCAYQSTLWGGLQGSKQAAADTTEQQAMENTIVGFQLRTFDGIALNEYWISLRQKDEETAVAILKRVRPVLRQAIEASIAAGVLHDSEVVGPLQRPEYILKEEQDAKRLRVEAGRFNLAAQEAGRAADAYIMLTLKFSTVLFFGGITGTFRSRRVRMGLACIALAIFIETMTNLVGLPLC